MSNNAAGRKDQSASLSPVVERSRAEDGSGIIGFTVTTPDGLIKNYMEPFDANSRDSAREKIRKLHAMYERAGKK